MLTSRVAQARASTNKARRPISRTRCEKWGIFNRSRVPHFSRSLREVGPRCDRESAHVTDEFTFLVTKLSPYYDR